VKIAPYCRVTSRSDVYYLIIWFSRPATKQSLAEKDAAAAAAAAKLAKEHELEKKVLEPRENEPLIRGHQDSGYHSFTPSFLCSLLLLLANIVILESGYFLLDIFSPGHVSPDIPLPDNPPHFYMVGHFSFHHHHPPVYNVKRSTVTSTKLIEVDRLASGVRV